MKFDVSLTQPNNILLYTVEGDTLRTLEPRLWVEGEEWSPPASYDQEVHYKKGDQVITATEMAIPGDLTAGTWYADFYYTNGGKKLRAFSFRLMVLPNLEVNE